MIVAAPIANLVIWRLGGNADRQEAGGRPARRIRISRFGYENRPSSGFEA
jgi:hypothetical protein